MTKIRKVTYNTRILNDSIEQWQERDTFEVNKGNVISITEVLGDMSCPYHVVVKKKSGVSIKLFRIDELLGE